MVKKGLTGFILTLFGVALFSQIIVVSMIGSYAAAEAFTNQTFTTNATSNGTSNGTNVTTGGPITFSTAAPTCNYNILDIDLGVLGRQTVDFDPCAALLPNFNANFLTDPIGSMGGAVLIVIAISLVMMLLGFLTSGSSSSAMQRLGPVLFLGALMISLLLAAHPIVAAVTSPMPVLGAAAEGAVALYGFTLILG